MEAISDSNNGKHERPPYQIAVFLLLVFFFSLWLGGSFNDFPFFYHPDEPSKVEQIIDDERNFHHPLLMLEVAELAAGLLQVEREPQAIVMVGRWLSALYTALAVTVIAFLSWRWFGLTAAVLTAWMLALHPDIYTLAHYFKEDPALMMGFAVLLLAAYWWERSRSWWALVALGAAAGLTVAAKYAGALALLMALGLVLVVLWRERGAKHKALRAVVAGVVVVAAAALTFLLVNQRMVGEWAATAASLQSETDRVIYGQGGFSRDIPHAKFVKRFARQTGPVMMPFYLVGLVFLWRRRKRQPQPATMWLLVLFPILMTVMLSFSAKMSGRYFLPAFLGIFPVVAYGAVAISDKLKNTEWLPGKPLSAKWLAFAVVLFPLLVAPLRMLDYWNGLRHSVRSELLEFVQDELPGDAFIIQGRHVWLPDQTHDWAAAWREFPQQRVMTVKNVADHASLAELRAQGITHVALSEDEYGKYLRENAKPREGYAERYRHRADFYRELAESCELLWQREARRVGTHNPPLRLWKL